MPTAKSCRDCLAEKPLAEFHADSSAADGLRPYCKPCNTARASRWNKRNPDKRRVNRIRSYIWRTYGLRDADVDEMLIAQAGRCAICSEPMLGYHIDHCHGTLKTRELLCAGCNMGLGQFVDSPERLRAAADYVERHREAHGG